ncbi:hypothetical protein EBZ39_11415 [bacterium]|nr:hypothetical protein [bacterium]
MEAQQAEKTEVVGGANKNTRAKFLTEWALQHPSATVAQARAALLNKFGMAMGTAYISETLKATRGSLGMEPKGTLPPPSTIVSQTKQTSPDVQNETRHLSGLIALLRSMNIKSIRLQNGEVSVEYSGL